MFNIKKFSVLLLALCLMLTWLPMANMEEVVELSEILAAEDALLNDSGLEGPVSEQEDFVLGGDDEDEEAPAGDEPAAEEKAPAGDEPAAEEEAPADDEPVEEDADEDASEGIEGADMMIEAAPEAFEEATYEEVLMAAALIAQQPQDVPGRLGQTVNFTISAPNATGFQWQYSKDGGKTFTNSGITGNKTDTITVFLKSSYMPYYWRCVVTGEGGKTETSTAAKVVEPTGSVEIKTQPKDAEGKAGDTVKFSVVAENVSSYQWQYSKDSGKTWANSGITGNKTAEITVFLKASYLPYYWRCIMVGNDGAVVASDAAKTVEPSGPAAVIKTQPKDAEGRLGDTVKFSIVAENVASYQWQYSKDGGKTWANSGITGNKTNTITVFLKASYLPYQWRCIVTGTDGNPVESNAAKTIQGDPAEITTQPQDAEGVAGDTVYFFIVAKNVANYQWQYSKDGGKTWANSGITGNKTDEITVFLKSSYLSYHWRCAVTGLDGVTIYSKSAETVPPQPNIIVVDHVCYQLRDGVMTVVGYDGEYSEYAVVETVNGSTVKAIGESAFENNTNLVAIDLPDSIEVIGKRAFAGCTALSQMS
ncbi:MAG: leucine-rich repeat protein [bacterium]